MRKLDRETKSSYSFKARVSDNGNPSLYVNVPITITVKDMNDNAPIFGKAVYAGQISEGSAIGSNVIQVRLIFSLTEWIVINV